MLWQAATYAQLRLRRSATPNTGRIFGANQHQHKTSTGDRRT
jgi:hypothetical protein